MREHRFLNRVIAATVMSVMLSSSQMVALAKGKGPWEEHIDAGRNALRMGDFETANSYLKQAMTDTAKFKDDDVRLGATFYEMGQLNIRLQNYTLAKEYYERALAVQQRLLGAESLEAAESLYGIALCNQQMGDHLAAEIFLRRVDEIWKKKLGARDPKLISILPSMASYASMKNNLEVAESYYRQLVEIAQQKGDQQETGTYMNLLATVLGNEGKFSEAKDYASRAVDMLKKSSDSSIAIDSAQDNLDIIKKKLGGKEVTASSDNKAESEKNKEAEKLAKAEADKLAKAEADKAREEENRKKLEHQKEVAEAKKKVEADKLAAETAKKQEEDAKKAAELAKKQEQEAKIASEKAAAAEQARLAKEQAKAAEQARIATEQAKAAEQARLAAEKQAQLAEKQKQEAEAKQLAYNQEQQKKAEEAAKQAAKQASSQQSQSSTQQSTGKTGGTEIASSAGDVGKPWYVERPAKKTGGDKQWGKVRYLAEGRLISAEEYKALLLANEAYEAMRQEKFRMAADILTKALDIYPELASAHTNLGLALSRLGQPDQAIEHLRLSIAIDPTRSAPWVNLASSFQTTGQLKECVQTYKEYLKRFPDDALAVKAKDLVKHLETETAEQAAVEQSIASGKDSSSGADYFAFTTVSGTVKWADAKLPLKVYVATGSRVPGFKAEYQGIMNDAFKSWSTASVDKVKFDFVNKPEGADIDCVWTNDYSQVSSPSEGGEAQVSWSPKGIEHVKIVILTADPTPDSPLTQNQVQAVCLHEIGHALGLIGHSPKSSDIMFCSMPSADQKVALSPRDVGTIKHLYSSDVVIALTPKFKSKDPSDKNAINNEGVELMSTKAYAQAIEKFEAALKLDPNYDLAKENLSRAYNNYAIELSTKGKESEAETLLQKAMKLQVSIRNATIKLATYHNYANILRRLKKDSEAAKVEAEAKSIDSK